MLVHIYHFKTSFHLTHFLVIFLPISVGNFSTTNKWVIIRALACKERTVCNWVHWPLIEYYFLRPLIWLVTVKQRIMSSWVLFTWIADSSFELKAGRDSLAWMALKSNLHDSGLKRFCLLNITSEYDSKFSGTVQLDRCTKISKKLNTCLRDSSNEMQTIKLCC